MNTKTKFHRDGTVTIWDVYQQQWTRRSAANVAADHQIMASLSDAERGRIQRMPKPKG